MLHGCRDVRGVSQLCQGWQGAMGFERGDVPAQLINRPLELLILKKCEILKKTVDWGFIFAIMSAVVITTQTLKDGKVLGV